MYVEIRDGKANPIRVDADKVDKLRAAGVIIIDCTNIEPKPQSGWLYDAETKIFSEPPPAPPLEPGPIEILEKKLIQLVDILKSKNILDKSESDDILKKK